MLAAVLFAMNYYRAAPAQHFDQTVIPVGKAPVSVAIADVNHDGKPDLIIANTADETISIFLGDGKGHFTAAPGSPFPCGKAPNDIAVADMNHDGNPDLIIANTETPLITVLLGDGKGGFKPSAHSPFDTHSRPHVHGVAVADFNGDGKPDVITESWGNNQILMFLGDGAGNLILPGRAFATGKRPYERLRSADFNQDGKADVVTTNLDDNTVSILLGDGHGQLHDAPDSPFAAGSAPWAVAVDDMNHDGKADLVILPYEPDVKDPGQVGVTILLGDGRGGFTKMNGSPLPLTGCRGPDRVAMGDLNGDGFRDIVVLCAENNKLLLFFGAKDNSFRVEPVEIQTGWSGLAVADLNGDGKDDIVVTNNVESSKAPGTVTILWSK
ncbi:MAG TPA: VCBS repeat-containing protein [Candidatus Angelobacter sp.]|nr:VCBS repeat-containing protein [Candidatus Angelobacter sp.]